MKKLLLILMLVLVSSSAMAEWVEFAKDDEETLTFYIASSKNRKNGNNVKIWGLTDYRKAQELPFLPLYMSEKSQYEFNCKEKQIKALYSSYHAKSMGGGKVIYSDNIPENWKLVSPDSIEKELWKFACGK